MLSYTDSIIHRIEKAVADLEGGRAGSPPPLGDGLTPSLTVMLANAIFCSLYCKTYGTQNKSK